MDAWGAYTFETLCESCDTLRAAYAESEAKGGDSRKPDGKDEKMEEILRKVDAEFLAMIKDAEEEESKGDDAGQGAAKK